MTKQEIQNLLGKMDDNAFIVLVTDINQIPALNAETATFNGKIFKYIRNVFGAIIGVWIAALALFPEIVPTPIETYRVVSENAPNIIASVDFSFSFPLPDKEKPWVLFPDTLPNGKKLDGFDYFIVASGISPKLL